MKTNQVTRDVKAGSLHAMDRVLQRHVAEAIDGVMAAKKAVAGANEALFLAEVALAKLRHKPKKHSTPAPELGAAPGYALWCQELTALAIKNGLAWLVDDPDWRRISYRDGMTPKEAFNEAYDEAQRSA